MNFIYFFFFKQKTAYEMRISDWSSDVCSSDLSVWAVPGRRRVDRLHVGRADHRSLPAVRRHLTGAWASRTGDSDRVGRGYAPDGSCSGFRSEEHTSELQSLMRNSYAVYCLKKTQHTQHNHNIYHSKTTRQPI